MKKSAGPHEDLHYLNLGPWPYYLGVTTSPKAFSREMKRLKIGNDIPFFGRVNANATAHFFQVKSKSCAIITVQPFDKKTVTKEMFAALIAHEAMHVVQDMQEQLAGSKSLGVEAEAYLIQQIVQEALQIAWKTGKCIRREPEQ